ncbi:MAG: 3-isopropylmalate dehydratase small subunit, partial [Gammaproteobacteria bacterium]
MKKIHQISGQPIPLEMNDVDTDLIIPAQFLTAVTKAGYGENLFRRLRESDPDFVFNQDKFKGANILITQNNFGCGSSREHAVWALQEAGIQAVIAVSFADIFFSNSAKNGLVLITLPIETINHMIENSKQDGYQLTIDIDKLKITSTKQEQYKFSFDPFRQHCLI